MDDRAANTKVESVVEAVEDLANAIFDGRATDRTDREAVDKVTTDILDKREALRKGLREFLQPRLRLMGRSFVQPYSAGTTEHEKVLCETCLRKTPCKAVCEHWSSAVRKKMDAARITPSDALDEACGGDVA